MGKDTAVMALSSGEAELMAVVKGTTEVMGLKALLRDLGVEIKMAIRSDATAAIGIVSRVGLGKVRHLAVSDLWVQQAARSGTVEFTKVPGQVNPADLFTKALDSKSMEGHARRIGQRQVGGRSKIAPCRRGGDQDDQSRQHSITSQHHREPNSIGP